MKYEIFGVLLLSTAAFGLLFGDEWNGLYVSWNAVPFKGFDSLPRHLGENKDFVLMDNQCTVSNSKFVGQRYWYKQDPALVLLYDVNGVIAGVQTSALKSKYSPNAQPKGWNDDGDYWTATAYFVDPSTICTTGRTVDELKRDGTGSGLWLQYGPDYKTGLVNIPPAEDDVKKTKWGSGKCFVSMGQHYWYNVSSDMNCDDFMPNCLLYNRGKLNAFCFSWNADLDSPRYDYPHPTNDKVNLFLDPVPKCFFTDPTYKKLTTMHIYFHSNPKYTNLC